MKPSSQPVVSSTLAAVVNRPWLSTSGPQAVTLTLAGENGRSCCVGAVAWQQSDRTHAPFLSVVTDPSLLLTVETVETWPVMVTCRLT